jgi:hypothetical protein
MTNNNSPIYRGHPFNALDLAGVIIASLGATPTTATAKEERGRRTYKGNVGAIKVLGQQL